MKKLSTSLKQNYGKLNENAVDSKETFFRFGKTVLSMNQGMDYSEAEANTTLQSIFDDQYPSYTDMLQELTKLIMSNSQKSGKAKVLVAEIFADIINDPNVSNYYPKLAKALSFDTIATVEAYVDNLSRISEQVNVSDIDLEQYYDVRAVDSNKAAELMSAISTPAHALLVIESALLLYSYILANVSDTLETENIKMFYRDIITVYNDFKNYSTVYEMDLASARNFFTSALSHTNPSYYLTGDKIETIVSDVVLPTFLASFMNIFMVAYSLRQDRLDKYSVPDELNNFKFYYQQFLETNKLYQSELFTLQGNTNFGSKKLKQLYYQGLQIAAKVNNMTNRRILLKFLNYTKPILDDLLTIEEREYAVGGGRY